MYRPPCSITCTYTYIVACYIIHRPVSSVYLGHLARTDQPDNVWVVQQLKHVQLLVQVCSITFRALRPEDFDHHLPTS